MNLYYLILIRVLLVGVHLWWLLKFANFRTHDKTIKFRFDALSWVRLIGMTLLNLSLFMPAHKMPLIYGVVVGNGMLVVTILQLRSIMLFGERYMFFKESGFEMRDVDKFTVDGIKVHMRIRGQAISFNRPITDVNFAVERFSGRRPRRR